LVCEFYGVESEMALHVLTPHHLPHVRVYVRQRVHQRKHALCRSCHPQQTLSSQQQTRSSQTLSFVPYTHTCSHWHQAVRDFSGGMPSASHCTVACHCCMPSASALPPCKLQRDRSIEVAWNLPTKQPTASCPSARGTRAFGYLRRHIECNLNHSLLPDFSAPHDKPLTIYSVCIQDQV